MSADADFSIPVEEIADHEQRNARGWPSETVERHYGWLFRYNGGVTRRANSVLPLAAEGKLSLDVRILSAEHFYRKHNCSCCFMISPAVQPADLDAVLDRHGYRQEGGSLVQAADLPFTDGFRASDAAVQLSADVTENWREAYLDGDDGGRRKAMISIMQRISAARRFAVASVDGKPVAAGLAIVQEGWVTLLGMQTRPDHRRNGHGGAIIRALGQWAVNAGASRAILQVEDDNDAARALYAGAGFTTLYGYHYRSAPG